jgi:Tol biopolymer transport system component
VMNPDGTGIQPVITMVGGVFDPDWSAAGIAFTALVDNRPRVWVADANGSNAHQISGVNSADRQPSWSPGGDKLVFMNTSRAGGPTLYWMFRDGTFSGGSPDQVTRDRAAYSPAWSPRGDLVAYVVDPHIWVIAWDARGFGAVQLTVRAPNADPSWSPDGQWIAFESWRDAANHEIYIMTANGGLQTRLTDHPALDYQPAWRP